MANQYAYGPRFPKSILHEFFQVHGGIPIFTVACASPPSAEFVCQLTIPPVRTPSYACGEKQFSGRGRSKKAAEHAAAGQAVDFLIAQNLMQPPVAVDPPSTASASDGRSIEEVHRMRHNLATISAQLSAMQQNLITGRDTNVPATEVENLTVQELRAELRLAQEENERLRAGLALEQERRHTALDALMNRPI